jgi:hypothetical protein
MPLCRDEDRTANDRRPVRTDRPRAWALLVAALVTCGLGGCGTINEKIASGAGDYVPAWAGGLPANAPPRPGTPEYDAWTKENERRRAMPAAERQRREQSSSQATDAKR